MYSANKKVKTSAPTLRIVDQEAVYYVHDIGGVESIGARIQLYNIKYDLDALREMSDSQVKDLVRRIVGRKTMSFPYLCTSETAKLSKSNDFKQDLNIVMHLTPSDFSGYQACASASEKCLEVCLNLAGRGHVSNVQIGRTKKTKLLFEHRALFIELLTREIGYWTRKAERENLDLAIRLNGTSDIPWEKVAPSIFTDFPEIQFYDYTKIVKRMGDRYVMPRNYDLTFSRTESNDSDVQKVLRNSGKVAIVFGDYSQVLSTVKNGYFGCKVVDGVITDRRFADKKPKKGGLIVALKALGNAIGDTSGFVLDIA